MTTTGDVSQGEERLRTYYIVDNLCHFAFYNSYMLYNAIRDWLTEVSPDGYTRETILCTSWKLEIVPVLHTGRVRQYCYLWTGTCIQPNRCCSCRINYPRILKRVILGVFAAALLITLPNFLAIFVHYHHGTHLGFTRFRLSCPFEKDCKSSFIPSHTKLVPTEEMELSILRVG